MIQAIIIAFLLAFSLAGQDTDYNVTCLGRHVCTAKDVKVALFKVTPDSCIQGVITEFNVTVQFTLSAATRYDMGFWANVLGGTTVLNTLKECAATMFTVPNDFFFTQVDRDLCGDQTKDGVILVNFTLDILCDSDTATLQLPGCATWQQNPGPVCNTASQAKPGSPSKCKCLVDTDTNVTVIKTPTQSPTSRSPTVKPTTKAPTNRPTKSPTLRPTTKSPTTKSPTTDKPTPKRPPAPECERRLIVPCPLFPTDPTAIQLTIDLNMDPNETAFGPGPYAVRAFRFQQPGDCIQLPDFDWEVTYFGDFDQTGCVAASFPDTCFVGDTYFTLDKVGANQFTLNFHGGWSPSGSVNFNGVEASAIDVCAGNGEMVVIDGQGTTRASFATSFPSFLDLAKLNPAAGFVFPFSQISSSFTSPNLEIITDDPVVDPNTGNVGGVGVLRYPGDCVFFDIRQFKTGEILAIGTYNGPTPPTIADRKNCDNYVEAQAVIIEFLGSTARATWCPGFDRPDFNAFPGKEGVCTYDTRDAAIISGKLTNFSICKTACGIQTSLFAASCAPALRTDLIVEGDFILNITTSNLTAVFTAGRNISATCSLDATLTRSPTRQPTKPTKVPTLRPTTKAPTTRAPVAGLSARTVSVPTVRPTARPTSRRPTKRPTQTIFPG